MERGKYLLLQCANTKILRRFTAEERVEAKNNKEGEMITLIIALIIIAVVTVFSVQNAIPVVISFLFWKFEASLAIILFLSVSAGVVIGVIGASLFKMKLSRKKQTRVKEDI